MTKFALVVEYDGTRYHGFQFQANATTIQEGLEKAIARLTGEPVRVLAASRTDAGVHARGQVVSFRTNKDYPPPVWVRALNSYLPEDIAVRAAYRVPEEFHVQRQAVSREYGYALLDHPYRSPLRRRYTCHIPQPLDLEAMDQACSYLVGEHDLSSFSPQPHPRPVRRVFQAGVSRRGGLVIFSILASSFLPHQVRHTAGALVRVGQGRLAPEGFLAMLQARRPGLAGPALDPWGLCLVRVNYPRPLEAA